MSKTISFAWSCSVTDRQRVDGLLCRSMQCDRCKEFRVNRDQAIIDMHLKEMEGREPQGLEKTAPETYLKLKSQIQALQKENQALKEKLDIASKAVKFYGSIENLCLWKTVKGVTQYVTRLPSDDCTKHEDAGWQLVLGGKRARQALEEIKSKGCK